MLSAKEGGPMSMSQTSGGQVHRSGADAILYFGTLFAGLIAIMTVGTACYLEISGKGVSSALAGWTGTIIGFYFSQLLHLAGTTSKKSQDSNTTTTAARREA